MTEPTSAALPRTLSPSLFLFSIVYGGMVVLAGNSGKLAVSRDNGQTFEVKGLPGRGYASVLKRSDGELLVVGDRGITPVPAALLAK